jgi:inner membrane protein
MKSIIRNFTTAFVSWIVSGIILIIYFFSSNFSTEEGEAYLIPIILIIMGACATLAFFILLILSWLSKYYKWKTATDYFSKIFTALLLYSPFINLTHQLNTLTNFCIWSLIATVSIITIDYIQLFKPNYQLYPKKINIMEQEQFNLPESSNQEVSTNYITKGVILLVMGLILFLSTFFVKNIISDRESTKDQSEAFFEKSWGPKQIVAGPYLSIPYKDSKGNVFYAYLMPKDLLIDNQVQTEKRKKGIFENIVYKNKIKSKGYFDTNDIYELNTGQNLLLDQAMICYGIEQISGLDGVQKFSINGKNIDTKSGLPSEWIAPEGLSANIPIELNQKLEFDMEISLKGTEGINFLPLGKNTNIDIASNWDSPSFQGKYIPNEKPIIDKNGFKAHWNIQHFNKTFPQFWLNEKYNPKIDAFGVDLKIPVNNYVKSERTIKYAILVIGLIFLIFFMIEINNKQNIHPIQYLLVGFSLCLFYGLLISFSELMDFNISYLIAAIMTSSMISIYIYSVLKQIKFAAITGISLAGIYTYLYIILQQEDYALLIGNLGLFIILGIIMYFSRKIQFSLN